MEKLKTRAIGMFDSGLGGLTVMKQIAKLMPHEHIVYFGDTARLPYGNKSPETIVRYSVENTIFLMQQEIKALLVACNTASSYAVSMLEKIFNIPIIGTIDPCAKKAMATTRNNKIGLLGTYATIQSGRFQEVIAKQLPDARVFGAACPLLVPLVEEQMLTHDITRLMIKEYLAPLKKEKIDTLILGCTHYPLLGQLIQEELGGGVVIVDAAHATAEALKNILEENKLYTHCEKTPEYRYFVTDDPEKFQKSGRIFFGKPLMQVLKVNHVASI